MFEKYCQITFKHKAYNETVLACSTPVQKTCKGQGPSECRTVYESHCTTKYVEKQPGKFVGESSCEKLPVEMCGAGCDYEEGAEECHDKLVTSVIDIPEEVCDINPTRICRMTTKLVPSLTPTQECTIIPKESCHLSFSQPTPAKKKLLTKWCLDESDPSIGNKTEDKNGQIDTNSLASENTKPKNNDDNYSYDDNIFTEDDVPAATAPKVTENVDKSRLFIIFILGILCC